MLFKNLYPDKIVSDVEQISKQLLQEWNIEGLILDIDNTLTTHDHPTPAKGVEDWLDSMRKNGIKLVVLSNNTKKRVEPFAGILNLHFIPNAKKPSKNGYMHCSQHLNIPIEKLCMVGDQLFTDVWGGKRSGCKTILVDPIQKEKMLFFRMKRYLEKIVLAQYPK